MTRDEACPGCDNDLFSGDLVINHASIKIQAEKKPADFGGRGLGTGHIHSKPSDRRRDFSSSEFQAAGFARLRSPLSPRRATENLDIADKLGCLPQILLTRHFLILY